MFNYKILKINFVLILFVACSTSSNLDDETLPNNDTESNIIENQELNNERKVSIDHLALFL